MKEIKPPRRDTGGQRGQGSQRDHREPASEPKKDKNPRDDVRGK
jgi:hypothetical protein